MINGLKASWPPTGSTGATDLHARGAAPEVLELQANIDAKTRDRNELNNTYSSSASETGAARII